MKEYIVPLILFLGIVFVAGCVQQEQQIPTPTATTMPKMTPASTPIAIPTYTPTPVYECYNDNDCGDDKICIENTCEKTVTSIKDNWRICNDDSDCVETQGWYCSCSSSGGQTAINKKYVDLWMRHISKIQLPCQAVIRCVKGIPKCINNRCEFVQISLPM